MTLGFAGSRQLLDQALEDGSELLQIQNFLTNQLKGLPDALRLSKAHFLCGLSQIAVGADTLFTRACRDLDFPQWIVLPEPRDEFLSAKSPSGTPDFTEQERMEALSLLESPHIIHEQVVSNAPDRASRFEEVNLEILRRSDVVVCLLREGAKEKPGGTVHLLELAQKRGRPTLELRVVCKDGNLGLVGTWHNEKPYTPPQLPNELRGVPALPPTTRCPCRRRLSCGLEVVRKRRRRGGPSESVPLRGRLHHPHASVGDASGSERAGRPRGPYPHSQQPPRKARPRGGCEHSGGITAKTPSGLEPILAASDFSPEEPVKPTESGHVTRDRE